jgi:CRP/FNR family transcriptional regulator
MDSYPGILSNLDANAMKLLNQAMIETDLQAGAVLFKKNDEATGMFILKSGRLQVVAGKFEVPGERKVLAEIEPGQIVGEFSVIDNLPRSATVIAIQDCELLHLTSVGFLNLITSNPEVISSVIDNLCDLILNKPGLIIKSEKLKLIKTKNLSPSLKNMKVLVAIIRESNKLSS